MIHGAFHGPWCWDLVARELRSRAVDVEIVDLPFTGFDADVSAARAAIVGAGRDAIVDAIVPDGTRVRFDGSRARDIFYGDSDDHTVAQIVPQLRPMILDLTAFASEPPPRPLARSVYVICTKDGAIPVAGQRRLAALCDEQVEWPTDHSPFLTRPGELARLLAGEGS
jgi:hypothetical protein